MPGKRGIDFGRDQYLDWTLPDPSRYISGKHCEVRFQNGEYLLFDVSTNGTFLNGSQHRMQSPHRLRTGDRLTVGDYIIAVTVEIEKGAETPSKGQPAGGAGDLWDADSDIAPPIDPRELRPPGASRPVNADFLEQAMGSPDLYDLRGGQRRDDPFADAAAPAAPDSSFDWAPLSVAAAPVEPAPLSPSPRRPPEAARGVWSDESEAPAGSVEPPPPIVAPVEKPAAPAPREPAVAAFEAAPSGGEFLARFAQGAELPVASLAGQDPLLLAQKAGELVRDMVVDMMQLLGARNEAKRLARSASQTVIQAFDNNPLKFSPTPDEALRIMLGPPTKSYLDGRRALAQGFADLKTHQMRTYSAMQAAIRMIAEELDPEAIDKATPSAGGLSDRLGSRKARLWEAYVASWRARTERHDDGLVDVFMLYFAECYDRAAGGGG